jgi:8-oxo-dGTP pyrophosphatase MutT (NUDIX family)
MATQPAPISPADPPVIKAAGGILLRSSSRGEEAMVVYRKRHQDWTLPRGKVKDGESFQEAAMREVLEETGCSCRIGNYLGTISYSANGVPKVVLFWKMTVTDDKALINADEIGEAVWLPIAAAIERLSYAQEKSLLSQVAGTQRQSEAEPVMQPKTQPAEKRVGAAQLPALGNNRAYSRLLQEAEAFRVELGFLERRNSKADKSWAVAAHEQMNHVQRCLENDDPEGGWFALHAAQRYAVFGMNQSELANQAYVLREEVLKISSWRGDAIENLLAVGDDQLTPERVADAMALRNADAIHQSQKARVIGEHLRLLLIVCALVAIALTPFVFLGGRIPVVAASLLFGLLGAAACAAQALVRGRSEPTTSNVFITITPVLFGAVAGLGGYAIYEYMTFFIFHSGERHASALLSLAFLFGCLGQRVLAHVTRTQRRKKAHA